MRNSGMVRQMDSLGRIVLPKELRNTLYIDIGDPLEFYSTEEKLLVLRKYTGTTCKFCGTLDELTYFKDSFICADCIVELKNPSMVESLESQTSVELSFIDNNVKQPVTAKTASMTEQGDDNHLNQRKRKTTQLIIELKELIAKNPDATQSDLAKMLQLSQGRVSQLKKLI